MIVRRLVPEEAAAFRDIRLDALQSTPWAFGSTHAEGREAPLSDFAERLRQEVVAGAFDGDVLAGVAAMAPELGGHVRHRAYVAAIFVRADRRGRGIARRLLDWLAAEAAEAGVLQLELHVADSNAPAIAAYEAAGFERHGIVPRAILCEGRFLDEILMVRRLD